MSDPGNEGISEDTLRSIVIGALEVPADVVEIGDWMPTPNGTLRTLSFPPIYEDPEVGTVSLLGQQAENGEIRYGVRINIAGDFSAELADSIRAAIVDAVDDAERNNDRPQSE
ncbi:Uncharacterised protein [Mycobacteroides abscessus subsp. abscessus]|uniref:hypothetical protein n=1 Tax=Mycobacteroides abscessus TaxID=36809 RepID=UPI000925C930|nr:hypothetical protein [Mycobacteroides abscessus]SIL99105.1 Uncharacterised protein [Mycobacteroides abscessus subsp. abscessus]SLC79221.1 Uncharacterised protein [Mycobacteroides abscessus subsp. abscessus]